GGRALAAVLAPQVGAGTGGRTGGVGREGGGV
ncbi:MAG: hypothetical protein AVDCRST_MAG01-01-3836, partial [uncultured Rubrobacteraceae bacterium]